MNSNLDFKSRKLEIWSKISTNENNIYELKDNIEAIVEEDERLTFGVKTYLLYQILIIQTT